MISFSASPCSTPNLSLEEALRGYEEAGFRDVELFSNWTEARFDMERPCGEYRDIFKQYGIRLSSLHLSYLTGRPESVEEACQMCRCAAELKCRVVILNANSKDSYIERAPALLDSISGLPITAVLTNHINSPIETVEDMQEILNKIANPALKTLLEVGQYHSMGISWQKAYQKLAEQVALVHLKDQVGSRSVRFGEGEVDIEGLLRRLVKDNYDGNVVLEMELENDQEGLDALAEALEYVTEVVNRCHSPK
ncbi:MAG: sugar phosphate isomerase/epimerase family protein [Candidatus Brocadiia bacterium]